MKKAVLLLSAVLVGLSFGSPAFAAAASDESARVGGHLKFYSADRTQGTLNGASQNNNLSAGISNLYLNVAKKFSDWLALEIQLDNAVSASATPIVGANISRTTTPTSGTTIRQAFFTAALPKEFELRAGVFAPLFSEDYGGEIFWNELYNQPYALARLQVWYDSGIELYRSFDFANWSLPAHLYYLNGGAQYVDTNENKTFLLHIAPEFLNGSLRFPLSTSYGKWDTANNNDFSRNSAGVSWTLRKLTLGGEYLYNSWQNVDISSGTSGVSGRGRAEAINQGYFAKAVYRFNDQWQAVAKYSHSELYKTSTTKLLRDVYDDGVLAIGYYLTPNTLLIAEYANGYAYRSDNSIKLIYDRYTLGWRITF